ncbi:PLP-dependent aminotransferase family protein [Sodalis endosymbiont of Spalangia cameroni]|uniref:MocR-like pyridoxine biosynthesis transcription factor PdxR n=1 Tax=Sodalis praecaptivus TaxID=1239307 RepID=UPI0031F78191
MRSLLTDMLQGQLAAISDGTLNRRLYRAIRQGILEGVLRAGSRLPATRDLAQQLAISRNTVSTAYDQLQAEGYISTRAGSGTFVTAHLPDGAMTTVKPPPPTAAQQRALALSARGTALLHSAGASPHQWGAFMPGVPDVAGFPHAVWRRIQARVIKRIAPHALTYSPLGGSPALRQALVDYLRIARSVICDPEQIVITEGTHQAIDLLAKMLCNPGDRVWVEEPSYWGICNVLAVNGVILTPVTVDDAGLNPPPLRKTMRAPKLIFVTPSHQYPTGAVMSLARRQRLLALAQEQGSWVVEDDYDSEFRFSGNPIPALQSLTPQAPVIYIGTFSKTLYPGLRISYMVLPQSLAASVSRAHAELYRGGHWQTQQTLAAFIREGHYASHIRRMRLLYGKRRALLTQLVLHWLGPEALAPDSNAGLHLILALTANTDDVRLAEEAARQGIHVRPLSSYYLRARRRRGLLLGYACVDEDGIQPAFLTLLRCIARHYPALLRQPLPPPLADLE